jgi:hypothetical protein
VKGCGKTYPNHLLLSHASISNEGGRAYEKSIAASRPFLPERHLAAETADLPVLSDLFGLCAGSA